MWPVVCRLLSPSMVTAAATVDTIGTNGTMKPHPVVHFWEQWEQLKNRRKQQQRARGEERRHERTITTHLHQQPTYGHPSCVF